MEDVSRYVGVPFVEHGRAIDGADCWGLARLVEAEVFGCFLPSYAADYEKVDRSIVGSLVGQELSHLPLSKTQAPEPGDLVLMTFLGTPCHVGVYMEGGYVLHSDPIGRGGSRMQRAAALQHRIEGFYRVNQGDSLPPSLPLGQGDPGR